MKKTLLYIFALLVVVSLASSTQAFMSDAYFEDGTTTTSINRGEDLNYYIDVFPNSYATSFNVLVRLFDETGPVVKDLGTLEDYKINSNEMYYSPLLPVEASDYSLPGDYFLDIKITQTAKDGSESISTETLKFSVPGERSINADFIYSPENPFVDEGVTFTSTSISEGHDILLEEWFIGSQKIGEGESITHNFDEPGNYSVTLKIKDDANRVAQVTKDIIVKEKEPDNTAPTADFTYDPSNPVEDEKTTFTSKSFDVDGVIVEEEWFVDGELVHQGVNETSFNHFFESQGSYDVKLVVKDDDGAVDEISKTIVVDEFVPDNTAPTADFNYSPDDIVEEDSVTFLSESFDVDGIIVEEEWFVDGELVHEGVNETSFEYTFKSQGDYKVKLLVKDDDGAVDEISKTVVVDESVPDNTAPTAKFDYDPSNPVENDSVTFLSESFDVDGIIVEEEWFVDGELVHEGVNETSFEYTFESQGDYKVKLLVKDDDGAVDEISKTIVVDEFVPENTAPTAKFDYSPLNPFVGTTITFKSKSFDVDGEIVREEWDFNNDGVYDERGSVVDHSFFNAGVYFVTLKVTDDDGASALKTKSVFVSKKPNRIPTANFTYDPSNPVENDSVAFSSESFDVDGIIVEERWFVDGELVHKGVNETSFNHVFESQGSYDVELFVKDDDNAVGKVSKTVVVDEFVPENVAPTAKFDYDPSNPVEDEKTTFTSKSFDVDGTIVKEKWFVDGELVHEDVNESSFDYAFESQGEYKVKLLVKDDDGAVDEISKTVVVDESVPENTAPTAKFDYDPSNPVENDSVTFLSESFDVDGTIVKEKWFVDGELVHEGVNETSFEYTFESQGEYKVKLLVKDDDGETDSITKTINVGKPQSQVIAVINGPQSPFVGEEVEYDGSNSYDTLGADIVSYNWSIVKDGVVVDQLNSSNPVFNYTFNSTGRHSVHLTAVNEFGVEGSTSKNIYASRNYASKQDSDFGDTLTVDYHYVYGSEYGVIETDEYFTIYITVTNRGDETLRNLKTTFALPEFGISEKSGFFKLRAGDTKTVEFHSIISDFDNIPVGDYDLLLGVAGEGITKYNYFPVTLK